MKRPRAAIVTVAILALGPASGGAGDDVDLDLVGRIRDQGLNHSRVMETVAPSVIVASFLYHAANLPERFPRTPMPQEPSAHEKECLEHAKERARRAHERDRKRRKLLDP